MKFPKRRWNKPWTASSGKGKKQPDKPNPPHAKGGNLPTNPTRGAGPATGIQEALRQGTANTGQTTRSQTCREMTENHPHNTIMKPPT